MAIRKASGRKAPDLAGLHPGEWAAIADGRVIAHGSDFADVAERACRQAHDIVFERVPSPDVPSRHAVGHVRRPELPPAALEGRG